MGSDDSTGSGMAGGVFGVRNAFSLADHASHQIGRMFCFENFSRRLTNDSESLRGRLKIICAGER